VSQTEYSQSKPEGRAASRRQPRERLFLETSFQVEKVLGYDRERLNDRISHRECWTSRLVLAEYEQTVLRDAVYLYSVVRQEPTRWRVEARLKREKRNRVLDRCRMLLSTICRDEAYDQERVLLSLSYWIEEMLVALFEGASGVEYTDDEINCRIGRQEPVFQNEYWYFDADCNQDVCDCSLPEFISGRRGDFQRIRRCVSLNVGADEKFSDLEMSLQKVLLDPGSARGLRCTKIKDCTISVECPVHCVLLTVDKHYEWVCKEALGKKVERQALTRRKPRKLSKPPRA
jgi:hypothetical protein